MVETRELAEKLVEEIRAGADMADLATRHSIRLYADENGGLYAMRSFEKMVYQEVMEVAIKAPDNELQGPIELVKPLASILQSRQPMDKAYSIFKVLQRLPARVQTYELSQRKAQYFARQQKQQNQLRELNLELRRKYYDNWGINAEALQNYADALASP